MAGQLGLLLLGAGCAQVQSSAYRTGRALPPSAAPVVISATREPSGAEQLGAIEVHGRLLHGATLGAAIAEFSGRVAAMGGDYGRLDTFAVRHEFVTEQYTYDCGETETSMETRTVSRMGPGGTSTTATETVPVTKHVPKTCTGERMVEVATLTLVGRALRTAGARR